MDMGAISAGRKDEGEGSGESNRCQSPHDPSGCAVTSNAGATDLTDVRNADKESDQLESVVQQLAFRLPPPHRRLVLLGVLQATDTVLTEAGIAYWITGGTLVGALRHGGFVPHDDDIDIECYHADAGRIKAALERSHFPAALVQSSGDWEGKPVGRILFWDAIFIDVFFRERPLLASSAHFPSEAEVIPVQRYSFHGLRVCGPAHPQDFLSRCYGDEWASHVRIWNHDVAGASGGGQAWVAMRSGAPKVTIQVYETALQVLGYGDGLDTHGRVLENTSAAETLAYLSQENGVLQLTLWEMLGWASPLPPPSTAAIWDYDE